MKKTIILSLLLTTMGTNAQIFTTNVSIKGGSSPISTLSVNSAGTSEHAAYITGYDKTLKCYRSGDTSWGTAIEGFSAAAYTDYCAGVHGYTFYNGSSSCYRAYGVLGRGGYAASGYSYGIFGQLIGDGYGAGVYGTDSSTDFGAYTGNRYAGFFNGSVRITSNLTVSGSINGTLTGIGINVNFPQKQIAANSIDNIAEQFRGLNACSYYKEDTREKDVRQEGDTLVEKRPLTDFQKQDLSKQHYALSADDLGKLFPDLVYDQEDGTKGINYIEMIPLLVQAVGELKSEINRLHNLNEMLVKGSEAGFNEVEEKTDKRGLGQNSPNPFSVSTIIPISIPETTKSATIHIYDINGHLLQKRDLSRRGAFNETITMNGCEDGLYLYSLVADGILIQTRRMILEK